MPAYGYSSRDLRTWSRTGYDPHYRLWYLVRMLEMAVQSCQKRNDNYSEHARAIQRLHSKYARQLCV